MKFKDYSEFEFIDLININTINNAEGVICGIGDDCSVRRLADEMVMLITTDMLVEGIHFVKKHIPPYDLGYKSLAVNLSDIAAMGGTALDAYISLGIPKETEISYMKIFYNGLRDLSRQYQVNLLGGDTTSSMQDLVINIVIVGTMPESEVIYRKGAMPGDYIYVTGMIGDSAAGLDIILSDRYNRYDLSTLNNDNDNDTRVSYKSNELRDGYLVNAHYRPYPYLKEGRWLAQTGVVNSMIDVSDGIASDLGHILKQSKVGARLDFKSLPLSDELKSYADEYKKNILKLSLFTGEDYVLLFTAPKDSEHILINGFEDAFNKSLYRIGEITSSTCFEIITPEGKKRISPAGWDHFKVGLVIILLITSIASLILSSTNCQDKTSTNNEVHNIDIDIDEGEILESITEDTESLNYAIAVQTSLRNISLSVVPAVVSIHCEREIRRSRDQGSTFDYQWNPELHRRRFGDQSSRERSNGSGVIISREGYIVTNNHVIKDADIISVSMDNNVKYEATIIGVDEKTDIALIKIAVPDINLPTASLGDSNNIAIGDLVIAVGNQFGLHGSVTFGIISAIGRRSGQIDPNAPFKDYIQTDAAINQGGSGGPLVNIYGQIIGINTSIFSTSGGSIGIGFSIPINIVKKVIFDLLDEGRVIWGFIGVRFKDIPLEVIENNNLNPNIGVIVERVIPRSPCEEAGILVGDIILKVNDTTITHNEDLFSIISNQRVGDTVYLYILRASEYIEYTDDITIPVIVGDRDLILGSNNTSDQASDQAYDKMGLSYYIPNRDEYQYETDLDNVVKVKSVDPDSPASRAGIEPEDIILSINHRPINRVEHINRILNNLEDDQTTLLIQIKRQNMSLFLTLDLLIRD